jgi:hypothetical protein
MRLSSWLAKNKQAGYRGATWELSKKGKVKISDVRKALKEKGIADIVIERNILEDASKPFKVF